MANFADFHSKHLHIPARRPCIYFADLGKMVMKKRPAHVIITSKAKSKGASFMIKVKLKRLKCRSKLKSSARPHLSNQVFKRSGGKTSLIRVTVRPLPLPDKGSDK